MPLTEDEFDPHTKFLFALDTYNHSYASAIYCEPENLIHREEFERYVRGAYRGEDNIINTIIERFKKDLEIWPNSLI